MTGKGSRPRPYSVSLDEYGKNFDAIFRKPGPKEIEDKAAEDEAFDLVEEEIKRKKKENTGGMV